MVVNYLYVPAIAVAVSVAGLQWWAMAFLDRLKVQGLSSKEDHVVVREHLELLLGSQVTIAFLALLAINIFALVVLLLKSLFFGQLHPSETRKVSERVVNYIIYKGTFIPLVVPSNVGQALWWIIWLAILCTLKTFQSLARDRLEQLNASPSISPSKYLRVYSALLLVFAADLIWMKLCHMFCSSLTPGLSVLMFLEPLSILVETLQGIMLHGFQLFDIWQHYLIDHDEHCFDNQKHRRKATGSLPELRGILIRHGGFVMDILTLSLAVGHYSMICWLRGMAFHLADILLAMNLRALVFTIVKRIKEYVRLTKALRSLDGALADATPEELCANDDECAICREPMARAKKLCCNHLFHLACLRSWLDQHLSREYSCPTCRRPLFQGHSVPTSESNAQQLGADLNLQRVTEAELPVEPQRNPADTVWRGVSFDSGWTLPRSTPGMEGPSSSNVSRSMAFGGVHMMMRQLTSVTDNFSHNDDSWNMWPAHLPQLSSPNRNITDDLHQRSSTISAGGIPLEIGRMLDRVREILPHMPDEQIIQDLLRTNNMNITVNNLLRMQ